MLLNINLKVIFTSYINILSYAIILFRILGNQIVNQMSRQSDALMSLVPLRAASQIKYPGHQSN
jgi:hypothetical protein